MATTTDAAAAASAPRTAKRGFLIIVIDFEARGDITPGSATRDLYGAQTLASFGAHPLMITYNRDGSASWFLFSPASTFSVTFPTMHSDLAWASTPLSASGFWAKEKVGFQQLVQDGHVLVSPEEYVRSMRNAALAYKGWLDIISQPVHYGLDELTVILSSDTQVSDFARYNSLLALADANGLPYNADGKYNGIRCFDYSQIISMLSAELNHDVHAYIKQSSPVARDHTAAKDAQAMAHECKEALSWYLNCRTGTAVDNAMLDTRQAQILYRLLSKL